MKGKISDQSQLTLFPQRLEDLVNPRNFLCKLSKQIVDGVGIEISGKPRKQTSADDKRKAWKRFRKRVVIEPIVGHFKSYFRLLRNSLKKNNNINLILAAAAYNVKMLIRRLLDYLFLFFQAIAASMKPSTSLKIVSRTKTPVFDG